MLTHPSNKLLTSELNFWDAGSAHVSVEMQALSKSHCTFGAADVPVAFISLQDGHFACFIFQEPRGLGLSFAHFILEIFPSSTFLKQPQDKVSALEDEA